MRMKSESFDKLHYLAYYHRTSMAVELENILMQYVEAFEKEHGPIKLPENDDV